MSVFHIIFRGGGWADAGGDLIGGLLEVRPSRGHYAQQIIRLWRGGTRHNTHNLSAEPLTSQRTLHRWVHDLTCVSPSLQHTCTTTQKAMLECKIGEEIDSHRSPLLPSPGYLPHSEGVRAWRFVVALLGQVSNGKLVESQIQTLAAHTDCLHHYDLLHDEFCP